MAAGGATGAALLVHVNVEEIARAVVSRRGVDRIDLFVQPWCWIIGWPAGSAVGALVALNRLTGRTTATCPIGAGK